MNAPSALERSFIYSTLIMDGGSRDASAFCQDCREPWEHCACEDELPAYRGSDLSLYRDGGAR